MTQPVAIHNPDTALHTLAQIDARLAQLHGAKAAIHEVVLGQSGVDTICRAAIFMRHIVNATARLISPGWRGPCIQG